jgi:5-methylcytosine-specific restriction endonuclease McrA
MHLVSKDYKMEKTKQFRGKPNEIYKCAICGNSFESIWGSYKYCSKKCRSIGTRTQNKILGNDKFTKMDETFVKENIDNLPKYYYLKLRFMILRRDKFTCQYCGNMVKDGVKLHVDHIIPKSKGGSNKEDNLITSCNICNLGKMDLLLTPEEISLLHLI